MISSYLEQPLRTLEQALDDRGRRGATARPTNSDITDPGSLDPAVRARSETADRDGGHPKIPLGRRHAA